MTMDLVKNVKKIKRVCNHVIKLTLSLTLLVAIVPAQGAVSNPKPKSGKPNINPHTPWTVGDRSEFDPSKWQYAFGIHNNFPAGTPNGKNLYSTWLNRAERGDPHASMIVRRLTKRPEFELYDLKKDPSQLKNLASDPKYVSLLKHYHAGLEAWMRE